MSKFDFIAQQLHAYESMAFHHHHQLAQQLKAVQQWQKIRLQQTHAQLFDHPKHQLIAQYFLNRLYGADDFDILAFQLRRIIRNAGIVEKVIPATALQTGESGLALALLSLQLDQQLAQYLLTQQIDVRSMTSDAIGQAYINCHQFEPRLHQLDLLETLGHQLDHYMRSRMVKTAFKLARGAAYRYRVDPIYEFIEQGFKAMEPLKSSAQFIKEFTLREKQILQRLFSGLSGALDVTIS